MQVHPRAFMNEPAHRSLPGAHRAGFGERGERGKETRERPWLSHLVGARDLGLQPAASAKRERLHTYAGLSDDERQDNQ